MARETTPASAEVRNEEKTILLTRETEKKFKICEVCGHVNSQETSICKMCSNYLEGEK